MQIFEYLPVQKAFIDKFKKIVLNVFEMIENTFFIYLDKKKKHLSEKSFSVFNGPPPNTIEHIKTFFLPNVVLIFSKYVKNVFYYSFKIFETTFCKSCQ